MPEKYIAILATELIIDEIETLVNQWRTEAFNDNQMTDYPDGLRKCANDLDDIVIKTKKKLKKLEK